MIMIVQKEKEEGGRQFSMVGGRSTCIASISIRRREEVVDRDTQRGERRQENHSL